MPKALERKLKRQAKRRQVEDEDAYVYGAMRKPGRKPSREKSKGRM